MILILMLLIVKYTFGQNFEYQGTYKLGTTTRNGRTGIIYIYPKSHDILLFYLELNRGAPSYNSGAIIGKMNMYSRGKAEFTMIEDDGTINCSMTFSFTNDSLYIHTNNQGYDCGYGYGVYSDGNFKRIDQKKPPFFINREGRKIWFKDLNWKD